MKVRNMNIRKRNGRYQVQIRRRGHKNISKTFTQKSDAMKWGRSVEIQLDRSQYRDTSNASKTTLISVLERHLKERLRVVRQANKACACVRACACNRAGACVCACVCACACAPTHKMEREGCLAQ